MNQPWWCLLHYYSQILGPSCGPGSAWAHAFNSNKPVVRWWHFKEIFIKHQANHGYLPTSRDTADLTLMFVGFPCGLLAMATGWCGIYLYIFLWSIILISEFELNHYVIIDWLCFRPILETIDVSGFIFRLIHHLTLFWIGPHEKSVKAESIKCRVKSNL